MARGVARRPTSPSRLAFNFTSGTHVFEEAAKFRAMRRMWARLMRERFGPPKPASCALPHRRGLGGEPAHRPAAGEQHRPHHAATRSRRSSAAPSRSTPRRTTRRWRLPTEESVKLALRTQQVLAYEAGVAEVVDPLGRLVLRRVDDERDRGGAPAMIAEIERRGRHGPGHRVGLGPAAGRRGGVGASAAGRGGHPVVVGCQPPSPTTSHGGACDIHQHAETPEAEQADSRSARLRAERDPAPRAPALGRPPRRRRGRPEPRPRSRRDREDLCHHRRDLRRAPGGLRGVPRAAGVLSAGRPAGASVGAAGDRKPSSREGESAGRRGCATCRRAGSTRARRSAACRARCRARCCSGGTPKRRVPRQPAGRLRVRQADHRRPARPRGLLSERRQH